MKKLFTLSVELESPEMERLILESVREAMGQASLQALYLDDAANHHRSGAAALEVIESSRLKKDIARLNLVVSELEQNFTPKEVSLEQENPTHSLYPANTERFDF